MGININSIATGLKRFGIFNSGCHAYNERGSEAFTCVSFLRLFFYKTDYVSS